MFLHHAWQLQDRRVTHGPAGCVCVYRAAWARRVSGSPRTQMSPPADAEQAPASRQVWPAGAWSAACPLPVPPPCTRPPSPRAQDGVQGVGVGGRSLGGHSSLQGCKAAGAS